MKHLPYEGLRARWISAEKLPADVHRIAQAELDRATKAPGWNVKVIPVGKGRLRIIDVCAEARSDRLHSARLALVQDHPFLRILDSLGNAPRAVKALYRADVRLALARASDGWTWAEMQARAWESWRMYMEQRGA